jgi:isoquinoline 1-oxidoreductase subunit beta
MAFTLKVNGTAHSVVVNPDTIAAQVEGGALFGLTAALYGAITHMGGRVEQSKLRDYQPMRVNEDRVVETHIIKSTEAPGAFGQASCACVTPVKPMRSSP